MKRAKIAHMNKEHFTLDKHGYLADINAWNEAIAAEFARDENITLTEAHWQVVKFLREFYLTYNLFPAVRILIKELQKQYGMQAINSAQLQTLFPKSPIRQAARIAGLPRPVRCI